MTVNILRIPAVTEKTGLSRWAIYRGIKNGTFPSSVQVGERAVGFVESELDAVNAAKARGASEQEIKTIVAAFNAQRGYEPGQPLSVGKRHLPKIAREREAAKRAKRQREGR